MKRLLRSIKYADDNVWADCLTGFPLVGELESVSVFEQRPFEEVIRGAGVEWLTRTAVTARRDLIEKIRTSKIDDIAREIYKITTDETEGEVALGWASGPYTEDEMSTRLGTKCWIAARRFGVSQKDKIRQIDDFSEYFVNACTTTRDKVTVAGVDAIAGFAKLWADKVQQGLAHPDGKITMNLADGTQLEGSMHEAYRANPKLVGKCIDLEAAYNQCPIASKHSRFAVFALENPKIDEVEFFEATALPFGAAAAVHGFNRTAMALNHLVHEYAGTPCTHYFDDFTIIVPEALGEAADMATQRCWKLWDGPSKRKKTFLRVTSSEPWALSSSYPTPPGLMAASPCRMSPKEWKKSKAESTTTCKLGI